MLPCTALAFFLASSMTSPSPVALPENAGAWKRPAAAKQIGPRDIFDYMDGAGELYLGYRFRLLDVWEYTNPKEDGILVELYSMESAADAFGLLSGDWGGEPVDLGAKAGGARALYGAGLLRIWSGNLFARVMSYQETEASKQAVLALGQAIVAGRGNASVPALFNAVPATFGPRFRLDPNRTVFLRSHLVLNSVYFLSSENLLDLGPEVEAVAASYKQPSSEPGTKPARLLLIRYPSPRAAETALRHFQKVYLPDKRLAGEQGYTRIEDGWMGFLRAENRLALVFESPDEASARLLIEHAGHALALPEISQ